MKACRMFAVVECLLFVSASLAMSDLGGDNKSFYGTATFWKPSADLLAVYEESIWPAENLAKPQLPLPDKNFRIEAELVMMAEGATIISCTESHPWWSVRVWQDDRKEISIMRCSVVGSWNPARQPVQDKPIAERGCSVIRIKYKIHNPNFYGLGIWINGQPGFFGIRLKKDGGGNWEFGEFGTPGYVFPAVPWAIKPQNRSITWGALREVPR